MSEKTLQEIEKEIAETQAELANVHGDDCEVYARIVGYYRAVRNWNKGKKDEYKLRKLFSISESPAQDEKENAEAESLNTEPKEAYIAEDSAQTAPLFPKHEEIAYYELYTRESCPNCPAVKNYMDNLSLEGHSINVDTKDGLDSAAARGVLATPTVIFYNTMNTELFRAHNTQELQDLLEPLSTAEIA